MFCFSYHHNKATYEIEISTVVVLNEALAMCRKWVFLSYSMEMPRENEITFTQEIQKKSVVLKIRKLEKKKKPKQTEVIRLYDATRSSRNV